MIIRTMIITYKSLTGDYSMDDIIILHPDIITYKSLTGDYSFYP